jgi:hypothetical protein
MEAPKCRLCGQKHMLSEPHVFKDAELHVVTEIAKAINEAATMKQRHCPTCRCFPMTAAERQKAYRERHKTKP